MFEVILKALVASLAFVVFTALWLVLLQRWAPSLSQGGRTEEEWRALLRELAMVKAELRQLQGEVDQHLNDSTRPRVN